MKTLINPRHEFIKDKMILKEAAALIPTCRAANVLLLLSTFFGFRSAWAGWNPPESTVTPPAVVTLDVFAVPAVNGANPTALVVGPDGTLYGSTFSGGTSGNGVLFNVTTNGVFTKLHDFNYIDGSYPAAPPVTGPDGALYGATFLGGSNYYGVLFSVTTKGGFAKLHDFNYTDGDCPTAPLVVGPDGALYGSSVYGGTYGYGVLFNLTTNGVFTKLHDFNYTDGSYPIPNAGLVVGPDGALYASTWSGGTYGHGVLFNVTTNGVFTKLHDFNGTDGSIPNGALVVGPDGALYGSTSAGGIYGNGALFSVTTNAAFTKLHDFNGTDGFNPRNAPLVVGRDGALYGSTYFGGANGYGVLFSVTTNGVFTKVHDFTGDLYSNSGLVVGPDGALYGSSLYGGTYGYGVLFSVTTNGVFTKLYDFNYTNGATPTTAMVVGSDGALYGSTYHGGSGKGGILFKLVLNKLVLNRPPVARCKDVTVSAGANCSADASIDDGSSDPDSGDVISITQSPAGPYPIGTNQVTLTVTDNHGASDSCAALVIVQDTTPPQFNRPADMTVNCTSAKGAVVTFALSASDDCSGLTVVTSTPSSGSLFPIGTTAVQCAATDQAGNSVWYRFQVTVLSPAQMLQRLKTQVDGEVARPQAMDATLNAALASLQRGKLTSAINQLQAFQNKVHAQIAQSNSSRASSLISAAQEIISAMH